MAYYKWVGDSDFHDAVNDRVISPGEVVELDSGLVGDHDFVVVDEPSDEPADGDEPPDCEQDGCSRTVKGGGRCWQHEDDGD